MSRKTHAGTAAFAPWMERRAHPGTGTPEPAASAGLAPWLAGPRPQHAGHNPQLDNAGSWPQRLVRFSSMLHRPTIDRSTWQQGDARVGWRSAPWASYYHYKTHETYVDVPLWAVLGAPGMISRSSSIGNYGPFRRAQPAVKAQSLAQALAASAAAIQAASKA
jgi:hypothetical protein